MSDREKVIRGLECHQIDKNHRINCADCPYYVDNDEHIRCVNDLNRDALALLKEQETVTVESIQVDRSDKWGADLTGYCPSCKRPLKSRFNKRFCGECGQEVKWDA